ncbi:early nodulin-like protein 1 [Prosopis cineraria]|uniref:early nodulin-like protein 1 n=1 Tax=Prosopis cineraria TaxID=364024 RepID=UPI0024109412|nr:early nodulin-like protein 1 [Prosopis cineraria]
MAISLTGSSLALLSLLFDLSTAEEILVGGKTNAWKIPSGEYNDDNTKVKLDCNGPFYFVSGLNGHCKKGQKLIVVFL